MIIVPIRTDRRLRHMPWMNYLLIGANVVIFFISRTPGGFISSEIRPSAWPYFILPSAPHAFQFITYQFLHANLPHLLGNMLFLYVFGNSVEDRFGKIGYLGFYLAGGITAGLGHVLVEEAEVLGASGAVAAVTGAYLALFPKSVVTLFYWILIVVDFFEISSMALILFYVAQDAFMFITNFGGVAYLAHLSGYAYGFAIGMNLLWVRLLPREPYDLLAMFEHRSRRVRFARMTRRGYEPWQASRPEEATAPGGDDAVSTQQQQIMELRSQITNAAAQSNIGWAAQLYIQLLAVDASQVMSEQSQLDLANQLMSDGKYDVAASAYELFLNTYRQYPQREQVELILGLTYARYLSRRQRAKELLNAALPRLSDPEQKTLARQTIDEISD